MVISGLPRASPRATSVGELTADLLQRAAIDVKGKGASLHLALASVRAADGSLGALPFVLLRFFPRGFEVLAVLATRGTLQALGLLVNLKFGTRNMESTLVVARQSNKLTVSFSREVQLQVANPSRPFAAFAVIQAANAALVNGSLEILVRQTNEGLATKRARFVGQ